MLPKTFVMAAPSIRIRVGSLIDRTASTVTPSLASTSWRAPAGWTSASHSAGVSRAHANLTGLRIGNLLERLDVHTAARVLELSEVGACLGLAHVGPVDLSAQSAGDQHGLVLLV